MIKYKHEDFIELFNTTIDNSVKLSTALNSKVEDNAQYNTSFKDLNISLKTFNEDKIMIIKDIDQTEVFSLIMKPNNQIIIKLNNNDIQNQAVIEEIIQNFDLPEKVKIINETIKSAIEEQQTLNSQDSFKIQEANIVLENIKRIKKSSINRNSVSPLKSSPI